MSSSKDRSSSDSSICAVIPFYNEKDSLKIVLDETIKYVNFIVAVNDGSDDGGYTNERTYSYVKFIDFGKNYGKGKALNAGFEEALSAGYEYIVTLDADLQHEPKYIPNLLEYLESFDIVIGNRLKNLKGMPIQRILSNKLTSFLLSLRTGQKISDSQCGFRAYRSEVLRAVKTKYFGFEAESEILLRAAKKGFKIGFIEIPTIYRNQKSKMKPFQAIVGFIRVLFLKSRS